MLGIALDIIMLTMMLVAFGPAGLIIYLFVITLLATAQAIDELLS